jgi:hypothetical protein
MSVTCKCNTSLIRNPHAYAVCNRIRSRPGRAVANNCATSSTLSTVGNRFGLLPYGSISTTSTRPSVVRKKKPQPRHDLVELRPRRLRTQKVYLERPHVLFRQLIRRALTMPRQLGHRRHVGLHRPRRIIPHLHVFDQSLPQRRHQSFSFAHRCRAG